MEKIYYLTYKNEKHGPFSKEELFNFDLNEDTLIWRNGLSNWTKLVDVPEFNNSDSTPPPIPTLNNINKDININLNMSKNKERNPFKKTFLQKMTIRFAKQMKYILFSFLLGLVVTPVLIYFFLVKQKYFIYKDEIIKIENSLLTNSNSEYYKEVINNEDIFNTYDIIDKENANADNVIEKLQYKKDMVFKYSTKDLHLPYLFSVVSLYALFLLFSIIKWIFKTSKIKY